MPSLQCKNCGGNVTFDQATGQLICDSCGSAANLSAPVDEGFYEGDSSHFKTYKRALEMMNAATSEGGYTAAARLFEEIPDVLNAGALAEECHGRAQMLQKESRYQSALAYLQSEEPEQLERAASILERLGDYKDCESKRTECEEKLTRARGNHARRQAAEERRGRAKKRRRLAVLGLVAGLIVLVSLLLYSPQNIKIKISPAAENHITQKYGDYVFTYDLKVKNKGLLDVSQIEGNVIFETKGGEVLVDTRLDIYKFNAAVVRAGKSATFQWTLTTDNSALLQTDFEDLKIKIKITKLVFTDGTVKNY